MTYPNSRSNANWFDRLFSSESSSRTHIALDKLWIILRLILQGAIPSGGGRRGSKQRGIAMKIKYCKKYEKYVSERHCEFFNEGDSCEFYSQRSWASIKDLLRDEDRPKWDANVIIKPFQCSLMSRENTHQRNRARRLAKRAGVSY